MSEVTVVAEIGIAEGEAGVRCWGGCGTLCEETHAKEEGCLALRAAARPAGTTVTSS